MEKVKMFFLMAFAMLISMLAFASDKAPFAGEIIDGKLYVEPGTVYVAPDGIFLNFEGNLIAVNSICVDEYGVHVPDYKAVRMVKCRKPECGQWYDADNQSSKCPHGWKVQYTQK